VRAAAGMEGGPRGRGFRAAARVGDVRDEELDDAIDLEIEKVRRTPCVRISVKGLLGPGCERGATRRPATRPSEGLRGTDRPCCNDARDPSPRSWSFRGFHITQWSSETGQAFLRIFSHTESSSG
jgi:hypothetical protein